MFIQYKLFRANDEITRLHKQHDDDTVALRFKYRQQEMQINSFEKQIDTLKSEKQELLDMCDELVARSERANDKTAAVAADY